MGEQDVKFDRLLRIRTSGRDDTRADQYRYPYEPTDYCVLERLANSGYIRKQNRLLDYGCGKGRVDFYLSYQTRCHSIGIEYDERMLQTALDNQKGAASAGLTQFVLADAVEYSLPEDVDRIFFFNPFSVELLAKVIDRILTSYYETPRELLLFFYYPSDEYVAFLMTQEHLLFSDEIDCSDLFEGRNSRERILIFETI